MDSFLVQTSKSSMVCQFQPCSVFGEFGAEVTEEVLLLFHSLAAVRQSKKCLASNRVPFTLLRSLLLRDLCSGP